jgi:hypothetical protein
MKLLRFMFDFVVLLIAVITAFSRTKERLT